MIARLRFPSVIFFVASFFGLLQVYHAIGGAGWRLASAALAYGFALGVVVQFCVRQPLPTLRIGVAAFSAALLLWMPVIIVTYGFALAAMPALIGYAICAASGAVGVSCVRKFCAKCVS